MFYAHTDENSTKDNWQLLSDHLSQVAGLSKQFADDFSAEELAFTGGLFHDIGKYSHEFQRRLEGAPIRVDHSTAGALVARSLYNPSISRILEYIITGHHTGILNYGSTESGLQERLNKPFLPDYSAYKDEINPPDLAHFIPKINFLKKGRGYTLSFFIRMLYSCIVDADSLDTERYADKEKAALRGGYDSIDLLYERFSEYIDKLRSNSEKKELNKIRDDIFNQCSKKAGLKPGLFSLTVPTGGGKTLSSMAFALNHMKLNGLNRVFYVIPYTSIIEQNAEVFRNIFGSKNVLEHHSNFDPSDESRDEDTSIREIFRLSCENWDIPVVVTTNVQFFESLFSHKRSRCRKIHNLAKSVIILDEAQMLPTHYLRPCLSALTELVRNYGSTVVICTATQPKIGDLVDCSVYPVEIVDAPDTIYEAFKRVTIENLGILDDGDLIERLKKLHQVLCIVNTRKHAQILYDHLSQSGPCFHLSAKMCPVHRRKHLKMIKQTLATGSSCRVISTQLIEAGVDIDFPVVFRAMTGIDSIGQAAGRCNREAKIDNGQVFIFTSSEPHGKATSWQKRVAEIGEMIIQSHEDPLSLSAVSDYFTKLYFYEGSDSLDRKKILQSLEERLNEIAFPFEDVSNEFRFIENNTRDIIIPYDETAVTAIDGLRKSSFPGKFARKLQGYSVSVYAHEYLDLQKNRCIEEIGERYHVLTNLSHYSENSGLRVMSSEEDNSALLIV